MDHFVDCFSKRFPNCFLHWEDFGKNNAHKILARYRQTHQTFNDDIQGTGAITTAAVLSAIRKSGLSSEQHRFCIFGAGTAGVGIAEQIIYALADIENKSIEEIRKRFYLIDRYGLIREGQQKSRDYQVPYLKALDELRDWNCTNQGKFSLEDVIKNAGITVLIGCSTATNAFNKDVLIRMGENLDTPIIMPLSNPTSKAEATPEAILKATDGRALIATGSPFEAVKYNNKTIKISQCNNALIFPGIGLGMLISGASILSSSMLLAASKAIAEFNYYNCSKNELLPDLSSINELSQKVAFALAETSVEEGLNKNNPEDFQTLYLNFIWKPEYYSYQLT